ncbi:primosomal protein N' [Demetria terragena]|uniref:primosomal protein N' n=1 Tax=Demetria terragena TaxID=63959 RepID=UPI00037CF58B|nr:primosomal protein N' [Demetria terragena]
MGAEHSHGDGQLHLSVPVAVPARRASGGTVAIADVDPIAVVRCETGLPHLDRPFEYLVPQAAAQDAVPGARVRVRFAGQDVAGFIVARRSTAEHEGKLAPLRTVVSSEPVLTASTLDLAERVAARYAGTVEDVLRLAIPPRHARAEKALSMTGERPHVAVPESLGPWEHYPAGPALVGRITAGGDPAASWLCHPGAPSADAADPRSWSRCVASLAGHALAAGRGVLILVPDSADVDELDAAMTAALGTHQHVRLSADQGAQARYTAWLKVLRGHVRCVIGTRAAAYAPVTDLGLIVSWDDGDDSFAEPRAPYAPTREVLRLRAEADGAALVLGGYTRSVPVQQWLEDGFVRAVEPAKGARRPALVYVAGEDHDVARDGPAARAHLPSSAWRAAKKALELGPVLVQVPRRGYLPSLSCQTCRRPSRCQACQGPLSQPARAARPVCRWCGTEADRVVCPSCGDDRVRSGVVGASRTAEELGRAFPGVPVIQSSGTTDRPEVGDTPALVIATPGAEPTATSGYAATLLLDAWALLDRPALDAGAEAFRRWCAAAALTRSRDDQGAVVLCGAPTHTTLPPVEALVRWAPAWYAEREVHDRRELGQPPASWMAMLTGGRAAVQGLLDVVELTDDAIVLGPLEMPTRAGGEGSVQALIRASHDSGPRLAKALHDARSVRSARKTPGSVQVRIDPHPSLL